MELYRIYLGPYLCGRVDLMHRRGEIMRGEKIAVTPDEAAAMDRLPKQWRDPAVAVTWPGEQPAHVPDVDMEIQITQKTKVSKTRKRKGDRK